MIFLTETTTATVDKDLALANSCIEKVLSRKDLGFHQTPERSHLWTTSQRRGDELRSRFSHMVVLGIGGSAMGGQTILESLALFKQAPTVDFLDNIDSHYFWRKIKSLKDLKKTHWLIISKSGNTLETIASANYVNEYLKSQGINLAEVSTVVSEPKSNMLTDWANKNKVPVLELPIDVGGRFSVLTPVGLVPAAFLNLDLEQMRQGALWGAQERDLASQLIAQSIASLRREEWITGFWSYCDSLKSFGLWVQQLWSESLAKKVDRKGKPAPRASTPIPLIGSRDQHSVLQQVAEGYHDKFLWFIRVSESEDFGPELASDIFKTGMNYNGKNLGRIYAALAQATAQGLKQVGVQSLTLRLGQLREKEVGALFMLFQIIVAGLGEYLDVNAFDQPGVELGKRLAKEILQN